MASNRPEWQKQGSGGRKPAPKSEGRKAAQEAQRRRQKAEWQKEGGQERGPHLTDRQPVKWRVNSKLIWLAVLVLCGVAAWWLIPRTGQTLVILAAVTEFDSIPCPPNAYAAEDQALIIQSCEANASKTRVRCINGTEQDFNGQLSLKGFREQLGELTQRPANRVVVYLSTHGVVNERRDPCLLFSDSDPLKPATWLKVADLVRELGGMTNKPTLLLLDASKMVVSPQLLEWENRFAECLASAQIDNPHVAVITAAGPGQRAWVSYEQGGSAFGIAFARALLPAATTEQATSGDVQLTLGELYGEIKRQVTLWAGNRRLAHQVPQLLPKDLDGLVFGTDQVFFDELSSKRSSIMGRRVSSISLRLRLSLSLTSGCWTNRFGITHPSIGLFTSKRC